MAPILAATVAREGGRWFVSFTGEVERQPGRPRFAAPEQGRGRLVVFTRPMRGSTTWLLSATRIAPVVNRTDSRPRPFFRKRGNSTRRPLRLWAQF